MTSIRFKGRTLYLSKNLAVMRRQLCGEDFSLSGCLPLRDDISTDEITPTTVCLYHDQRLARFAHIGLKVGNETPVGVDALRSGGFEILVAGKRYGKTRSAQQCCQGRADRFFIIDYQNQRAFVHTAHCAASCAFC